MKRNSHITWLLEQTSSLIPATVALIVKTVTAIFIGKAAQKIVGLLQVGAGSFLSVLSGAQHTGVLKQRRREDVSEKKSNALSSQ